MNPTRLTLALALAMPLVACNGNKDDDSTTDDTVDTVETAETAIGEDYLDPDIWIITAEFGFNPNVPPPTARGAVDTADTDVDTDTEDTDTPPPIGMPMAVPYTFGTSTNNPLILIIGQQDKNNDGLLQPGENCITVLSADGAKGDAPWRASFTSLLFAFEYGDVEVEEDDCGDLLDPVDFPDFGETMADADWAVGVAATASSQIIDALDGIYDPNDIIGGGFAGDLGELGDQSGLVSGFVFTTGFEVNEQMVAQFDDASEIKTLTKDQMVVDGQLQRAGLDVNIIVDSSLIEALY